MRTLGPLAVSSLAYGAMSLSGNYGPPPARDEAMRVLNRALDLGVSLIDTAALYGDGENEPLVAEAIMHRRGSFTLASKCVLFSRNGVRTLDGSPQAITETLENSLRRLRTDRIDLYYLHRLDRQVPIEDSVGALARAVEAGKIRAIGLSEMSAETLRRAYAVHPIAAMQTELSPMVRNAEIAVLDACRELGVGFAAFSPTARGLLAGRVRDDSYVGYDIRTAMPRFTGDNLAHNLRLVDAFAALARSEGVTPAQLSLAWVAGRGEFVVPLFGTSNIAHLEENVAAARVTLSPETVAAIDRLFDGTIAGPRYPAQLQAQVDTETFPGEMASAPA